MAPKLGSSPNLLERELGSSTISLFLPPILHVLSVTAAGTCCSHIHNDDKINLECLLIYSIVVFYLIFYNNMKIICENFQAWLNVTIPLVLFCIGSFSDFLFLPARDSLQVE